MSERTPGEAGLLSFADYPMGPQLRAFLGIEKDAYTGHSAPEPDDTRRQALASHLIRCAKDRAIENEAALIDLLDELVTMNLPEVVVELADTHTVLFPDDDFRAELAVGIAAMMTGDLGRAEGHFRHAQSLIPEEPAPYVNLAQILRHNGRYDEALTWTLAGLDAERNNFRLWELVALLHQDQDGDIFPEKIQAIAEARNSWAGLALSADVAGSGDPRLKLSHLEKIYFQGERDPQFLVELTAAMGVAGENERIPALVWQAESQSKASLPWQLHVHCAQAQLQLNKADEALKQLEKARRDKTIPPEVMSVLNELEQEAHETAKLIQ